MSPLPGDLPGLPDRLDRATPTPPDAARFSRLASDVEHRGRRRRSVRRGGVVVGAAAVVALVVPLGLRDPGGSAPVVDAAPTPTEPAVAVPDACLAPENVNQSQSLDGETVWVRFCPGREGRTDYAEVPSDALTDHLDFVAALREEPDAGGRSRCDVRTARGYRLQIGFADGRTAELVGRTDPTCPAEFAHIDGTGLTVTVVGPDGLGVYGAAMAAFGEHYADRFEAAAAAEPPASCSTDPDRFDVDGASDRLDTGWILGERAPMLMPLTAVRGWVCTIPFTEPGQPLGSPVGRELSGEEAERVRIGMHAIAGGMVDCAGSSDPTYTAVVEDKTGTRRAVTIIGSECDTVIRSGGGYAAHGLGFSWLDR